MKSVALLWGCPLSEAHCCRAGQLLQDDAAEQARLAFDHGAEVRGVLASAAETGLAVDLFHMCVHLLLLSGVNLT